MNGKTLDEILHGLFALTIAAAAIFVKNPASQQHAVSLINVGNSVLLPLADSLLNPAAVQANPAVSASVKPNA